MGSPSLTVQSLRCHIRRPEAFSRRGVNLRTSLAILTACAACYARWDSDTITKLSIRIYKKVHAHFAQGSLTRPITLKKLEPYPVLYGQLVSATSHFVPVYVKLLPPHLRMVEVVCAWLAREVGLPLPLPAIVDVHRTRIERLCPWPYGSEIRMHCFGTHEILQARPLQVVENANSGQYEHLLRGWKDCLRTGIFDELIANDDRNKGNLLLDAHRGLWIIDHSRALRSGGQTPFSDPLLPFENPLLNYFAKFPAAQRSALYPQVVADCAQLSSAAARIPYGELGVDGQVRVDIERFIDERSRRLAALVFSRLGINELPLQPERPSPRAPH